jgi:hypothetical protein
VRTPPPPFGLLHPRCYMEVRSPTPERPFELNSIPTSGLVMALAASMRGLILVAKEEGGEFNVAIDTVVSS